MKNKFDKLQMIMICKNFWQKIQKCEKEKIYNCIKFCALVMTYEYDYMHIQ